MLSPPLIALGTRIHVHEPGPVMLVCWDVNRRTAGMLDAKSQHLTYCTFSLSRVTFCRLLYCTTINKWGQGRDVTILP